MNHSMTGQFSVKFPILKRCPLRTVVVYTKAISNVVRL